MSQRETILRYSLIINKVRSSPCTLAEIRTHLKNQSDIQDYNFVRSEKGIERDRTEIFALYNIDIRFDFSRKVYRIMDEEKVNTSRLLEAFDMFNTLNVATGNSDYMFYEIRKPKGTEHLHELLKAIKDSKKIVFTYQKFWEDEISERHVEPYALKEFKGRWYILAKDDKDGKVKTFGLDRIQNLSTQKVRFTYPENLNVKELYQNCFGIINPENEKPQKIHLSFDDEQGKYIESFPLHASQQTLIKNDDEYQFGLEVLLTHDFVMEILSYGSRVKVISPDALKKKLITNYEQALKHYHS
jgi:hypothetical protein